MTEKATARIIGILFIVATAAASLSQVAIGGLLDDENYLMRLDADAFQVRLGAVLDFVTAAAVVAIAVMLYRVLARHSEVVSIGYLSARLLEAAVIVVGAVHLLALLTVSEDFVANGAADQASFETTGSMLLATRDITDATGTQVVFAATALILNYSLYRSRLVPRFISIWGLIGAPLMVIAGLYAAFGGDTFSATSMLLVAPLAINEMVLALWLIVKGFNTTEIDLSNTPTDATRSGVLAASSR